VFSAHGQNFVKTMLRLGAARDSLNVVADQIGGPTPARAIAAACLTIAGQLAADPAKSGTYHFAGTPDTSWAEFARAIMAEAGLPCTIQDIPTSAYPTPAQRPRNSRLDCSATTAAFTLSQPDWRKDLTWIIRDLAPQGTPA
jgi:dTDP-4-dehydrorhamnose reductase